MELHPTQITKSATNSHLLGLLTKRSSKSIQNLNKDWPGKHAPSLANIVIRRNNQKSVKAELSASNPNSFVKSRSSHIKNMPLIKMSSTTLSLLPTARSKTIAMHETWRSTKNKFYSSDTKALNM